MTRERLLGVLEITLIVFMMLVVVGVVVWAIALLERIAR